MLTPRQLLAKKVSPLHHHLSALTNTSLLTQEEQSIVNSIRRDLFKIVMMLETPEEKDDEDQDRIHS